MKLLFQAAKIGNLSLRNRIVMPAMGTNFADKDGYVTERMKCYYEERAMGGVGMVIVEATAVDFSIGKNLASAPSADNDKYVAGLSQLANSIQKHGARVALQLVHAGREARSSITGTQPVAPSPIPFPGLEVPRELTIGEIGDIIAEYAAAAKRAQKAGFDGVEIHGGHGYLVTQFLSGVSNKRQDAYGGRLENRARLLVEVIGAIKNSVGSSYPVWCRINGKQYGIDGGITTEDAQEVARMAQKAGADAIHVSAAGFGDYSSVVWPEQCLYPGALVPLAAAIKKAVSIPVIAVGRLDPKLGERVLQKGQADFIALGRRLIADPKLPNKVASGKLGDIAPCTACMNCVLSIGPWVNEHLSCRINAAVGREHENRNIPAAKTKRVMVIGGGPAGMEAARVAAMRGHQVQLCEREHKLGGAALLAAMIKGEKVEDIHSIFHYYSVQLKKAGVKVRLEKEVNLALVGKNRPDVVIVAVGGVPTIPKIPGIHGSNVLSSATLKRKAEVLMRFFGPSIVNRLTRVWPPMGRRVVVIGGGIAGCQLADFLTERGRKVTLVETPRGLASGGVAKVLNSQVRVKLRNKGVAMFREADCEEVTTNGLIITDKNGARQTIEADAIVVAEGVSTNTELLKSLEGKVPEIYPVGDCANPQLIREAIADGYRIGQRI